ncbi:MAG: T9SS C-terminal target domain-containing protein [Calditrichaeota bacterium]|nr:MAG: T9SS C-terminal target domain-containing protein [Calditrichota bacterium]
MKRVRLEFVSFVLVAPTLLFAQADFSTSLHGTRQGKATWYGRNNGGFEQLTDIPMSSLPCQKCHAQNFADGTPVDPATYSPDCKDCHAVVGDKPSQEICLGCHSRQGAEITLSASNPLYTDVHRDAGMVCTDCHTKREMHGDGTSYASMLESGAMDVACDNQDCHPVASLPSNPEHDRHLADVYCSACHVQTVSTCFNCHFETEVATDQKRFYGPPPTGGFTLLLRRQGSDKVTSGVYMAMAYQGKTFFALSPFGGHTVTREGRTCQDCHNTQLVQTYTQTGEIQVTKWDATESKIHFTQGVIPVPPDWRDALRFDFVNYTGDVTDPVKPFDPTKWTFLKSGADTTQILYAQPLTADQMAKLAMDVVSVEDQEPQIPKRFALVQNYPNPFNPGTTIEFRLPKATSVTLKIFNVLGQEVATIYAGKRLNAGVHRVRVKGDDLPTGVYLYRLQTPEFTQTRKMTVLR